jgi:predicted acyltransferase
MSAPNHPISPQDTRVVAIDILRGLTIFVMVFVNDVAGVKGLPWWTYHIPAGKNGRTYVDVVFSAFLRGG